MDATTVEKADLGRVVESMGTIVGELERVETDAQHAAEALRMIAGICESQIRITREVQKLAKLLGRS